MEKPFHIYRSSAGSGKTRTLAREYIVLALRRPDYFKHILAVTFANKSSQEMKDRVIAYLSDFADGKNSSLTGEVCAALSIDGPTLVARARETLTHMLHEYSQFSISTIDAFFQRVIRSFTREAGLLGNFRLEAENEIVLDEVIAKLMDELGDTQKELTEWVVEFSRERLLDGESWNITSALKGFSREVFRENFKIIGETVEQVKASVSFPGFLSSLQKQKQSFFDFMEVRAKQAMEILNTHNISVDDFNYKDSGTAYKYFKEFANRRYVEVKQRILNSATDPGEWPAKASRRNQELRGLAQRELMPLLNAMIEFDRENIMAYNSADLVEQNFYAYGLISDILRKLKEYKAENNVMLLSDASFFLRGVIGNSDTPFVYEKVGSFYKHYLIDEFQDTSELQWRNFQPLLHEALDQNHTSLVVGDVKQSIYRWRGGDQGLLQEGVSRELGNERTAQHVLQENWRSAENLVQFNNLLFSAAAQRVAKATESPLPTDAFRDLRQKPAKHPGKGFVSIRFLDNWYAKDEDHEGSQALRELPAILEQLQQAGIPAHDVAILVRKNEEGQRVASALLHHKNSPEAKAGINYDVVSNESLRLDAASSVLLIISALKLLNNPVDAIAKAELLYEYFRRVEMKSPDHAEHWFAQAAATEGWNLLPEEFSGHTDALIKLSIFELTETLIRIFGLGAGGGELAYLQSFQDFVLEFTTQEKNDIASFLHWWEDMKDRRSIKVASNVDAAAIYTIHGAKGLQFRYVIVPFCSWKMGHEIAPMLWCRSEVAPYNELGYVAVRFTSRVKESIFKANYDEEFTKAYLDNLNLLYVACTRAEEGLIMMAPAPRSDRNEINKISNVGTLVHDSIMQSDELRPHWDSAGKIFTMGRLERLANPEQPASSQPAALKGYGVTEWGTKLVIRREGTEFFLEEKTDRRQRINYGILMHRALSMIHYKEEVEDVLKKLYFEGVILEQEMVKLMEQISAMMSHPLVGSWYTRDWQVRTEAPLIVPGGRAERLDRVIYKEIKIKGKTAKKAVIIDYKTGVKKTGDRQQVEEYARRLSQMGYVDVEGYLLYLETLEAVAVVDKMSLGLF